MIQTARLPTIHTTLQHIARVLAQARDRLQSTATDDRATRFAASVRLAFPDLSGQDIRRLQQRHQQAMAQSARQLQRLKTLSPDALTAHLDRHVQIDGAQVLDAVRSDPRPVVFVTPHYGDYALACLKLIQVVGRHKTINAFYNPPQDRRGDEPFETLFKQLGFGFNALFMDAGAVLRALRVLRRGEALTMMPDNFDTAGQPIYVPFFGRLAPAMAGTALFALKSRARVVIGFHCPGPGEDGLLKICAPIDWVPGDDLDADIAGLTGQIFSRIEQQIRVRPEHWEYLGCLQEFIGNGMVLGDGHRPDAWWAALVQAQARIEPLWPELGKLLQDVIPPDRQARPLRRRDAGVPTTPT